MEFLGFKFGSKAEEKQSELKSIAMEPNDGSAIVTQGAGADALGGAWGYSTSFELDPLIISEQQLITKYREMSLNSTIDKAIDNIINEVVSTEAEKVVEINLDQVEYSDTLKKRITDEFDHVVKLLDFNASAYEIIRRFYVDGRMQYQVVIDEDTASTVGIGKLTYLDPRKLKKVRVVKQQKDQRTGANLYAEKGDYYIYSEQGFLGGGVGTGTDLMIHNGSVSISGDAVVQTTSGLLDPTNSVVLSYLHKAIRPLNQLNGLEDAAMIYKLSRAPERRIFYIDVGNLPPAKAEQVLQKQMNQYRSKMIYDVGTGAVRSDPKQMTMIEDYWLPRRSDGKATEITTLPAGQMDSNNDLKWFLDKLYNSLNVPITRLDSTNGFSFGKTTEITRDEVSFTKFVARIRRRFARLFTDLLKRQLALKNILNDIEFENIRHLIAYDFASDNHFDEMLSLEVMEQRLNVLDRIVQYSTHGQFATFFSREFIYKNILFMSEEEIEEEKVQIAKEEKEIPAPDLEEGGGPNVSTIQHQSDTTGAAVKKSLGGNNTPKTINNTTETNKGTSE